VPACPSGKSRLGEDKAFGSGEGKMVSGARTEVELKGTIKFKDLFRTAKKTTSTRHSQIHSLSNVLSF
jgi:hypothetical protein